MKVHYPKLYNMAHLLLSLNVFTASKGSNNYVLFLNHICSSTSDQSRYTLWSCQNVNDALSCLLDGVYIRFGTRLYR